MPDPNSDHYISQDERILNRLRPFVAAHVDALPEATRETLQHHLDEHGGALRLSVEREGDGTWHVVAAVDEHRLCGVDALAVGLDIDDDGVPTYRPDPLLDDDLLADDDGPSSWFD